MKILVFFCVYLHNVLFMFVFFSAAEASVAPDNETVDMNDQTSRELKRLKTGLCKGYSIMYNYV